MPESARKVAPLAKMLNGLAARYSLLYSALGL